MRLTLRFNVQAVANGFLVSVEDGDEFRSGIQAPVYVFHAEEEVESFIRARANQFYLPRKPEGLEPD